MQTHQSLINYEKRIDVLRLKNQGWSNMDLARKYDCSPQSISRMYKEVKNRDIRELEEEYNIYVKGNYER